MKNLRFTDKKHTLGDFNSEVWVVCPSCEKRALASINHEEKKARLQCTNCGYSKINSTLFSYSDGKHFELQQAAHLYFNAVLWFQHPFKNEVFWAYNQNHLEYIEQYISAKIREHKDRTHFTLLEKLPKFYHDAKNRDALLKLITKMKRQ